MDGYFVNKADPVQMLEGIIRRTLGTTDEAMLCEFRLDAGAIVPEHSHMNDQIGYIISGQLEITVAGEKRVLGAGESYAIPGGVMHMAVALVDTVAIDVFSPPRKDYRTEAR